MANLKSSKKQMKKNITRRGINLTRKTALKSAVKKVLDAIVAGDTEKAKSAFKDAQAQLARAKNKGLMHKNAVSRKVSRLAAKIKAKK